MTVLHSIAGCVGRIAHSVGVNPWLTIRSGHAKGLRICLDNADRDYWRGTKEAPVQQAIMENLEPGDVFLDIGSNIGFFALIGARCVGPSGRVYALEPVPENIRCLEANLRFNRLDNVEIVPTAASNCEGRKALFLAQNAGGATLSESDIPPDFVETTTVDVGTVDGLIRSGRIKPPNLVKIDVEGAEMEVLEGMRQTLADYRPRIVFEVDAAQAEQASRKYAEISEMLETFGYAVRRLDHAYPNIQWTVLHGVACVRENVVDVP